MHLNTQQRQGELDFLLGFNGNHFLYKQWSFSEAKFLDSMNSRLYHAGDKEVEDRQELERSLLRKLDSRMSILVLIYILNCM